MHFQKTVGGAPSALEMGMATPSLAVVTLATLLSGQTLADRQAYATYQAKLTAMMATTATTSSRYASGTSEAPCTLAPGAGNSATTADCTSCHATYQGTHSHPVDVYQDAVRSSSLRSAAEVVKRGVFLADGKITCLSCHDGNSTWKYKIALPPDSKLLAPVKPGDPRTYDPALMRPSPLTGLTATTGRTILPAGTEVSPTPLCKVCHVFD
jgi:hypothetical protein